MKKKAIRGQGGLEYLATYGWAIMVVMVLGIAVWRLGVLSSQPATVFSGFAKIRPQVQGTSMRTTGEYAATFINSVGMPMSNVVAVSVRNNFDEKDCLNIVVSPTEVAKNQHFKITADNCIVGTHHPNEIYEVGIKITYDIGMGTGIVVSSTDSGIVRGPYE